MLKKLARFILF